MDIGVIDTSARHGFGVVWLPGEIVALKGMFEERSFIKELNSGSQILGRGRG